jgi:branched-chain amino acid transport system substrate-binding protein
MPGSNQLGRRGALSLADAANREKVAQVLRTIDITDGPAKLFPDARLSFDEKGRRKGAKICIVQYQNGKPVPVYPESIATDQAVWPKTS